MENRFDDRLPGISPPAWPVLLAGISEVDEFKGWWRGRFDPPPSYLRPLRRQAIAASAMASVGIEWIGLPGGGGPARAVSPSRSEELRRSSAACYARLLKAVFDGHGEPSPTRDVILAFHAELMRFSPGDPARRGAWRSLPDRSSFAPRRSIEAIALRPADPAAIEERMDALLRWTRSRLESNAFHPLLVIAGFVLEFLAIRPFSAGNGRTSRLLASLLLFRSGYAYLPYASIEKVISDRKAEYYIALRKSQSSLHLPRPDMGPWFLAFLGAMRVQARGLKRTLASKPAERQLSGNQSGALALLERRPEITKRLVAGELGISRETAKQVLNRLVSLHLLARVGAGRAARYRKPDPA